MLDGDYAYGADAPRDCLAGTFLLTWYPTYDTPITNASVPQAWPVTEHYIDGGNTGNAVWRFAASTLFAANCLVPLKSGPSAALVFEADMLQPDTVMLQSDMAEVAAAIVSSLSLYRLVFQQTGQIPWLLHLGSGGGMNKESRVVAEQRSFLERMAYITTRGLVTTTVLNRDGIASLPVGCPSLFLNHRPDVGLTMLKKTGLLVARELSSVAFAINLPASYQPDAPAISAYLVGLLDLNNRSRIVAQTMDDFETAKRLSVPFGRILYFITPASWFDGMKAFDAVIGCRIHGGMMGVASELPTVVITIDSRVLELVEIMKVPHATPSELLSSRSVLHLFRVTASSLLLFDSNRHHAAHMLRKVYDAYNVTVSSEFADFAGRHPYTSPYSARRG